MRMVKIVCSVLLILIGIGFSVLNPGKVMFHYFFGSVSLYLSVLLFCFFLFGLFLGLLVGLFAWFSAINDKNKLKNVLNTTKRELEALRMMPFKDA